MKRLMAYRAGTTGLAFALGAVAFTVACNNRSAEDEFDSFLARADRTPAEIVVPVGQGVLVDIQGSYLFNIDLGGAGLGDVRLPLRVTFDTFEVLEEDAEGNPVRARTEGAFRFPDDPADGPPLATFSDVEIGADGVMDLDIGYVRLEPERSPIQDTAVEVDFILRATILGEREICGLIADEESAVFQPISIPLRGVTFGALRYGENGEIPVNVPLLCPVDPNVPPPDAGADIIDDVPPDDVSEDVPEDGDPPIGPVPPDTSALGPGERSDISGSWFMAVGVAGGAINLDFLAEMQFFDDEENASLIGALRITTFPAGTPAVATFAVPVDEDGRFEVVVNGLIAPSRVGEVEADIALAGVIRDGDFWCGLAAGTVRRPFPINLAGTTFGAIRLPEDIGDLPFAARPEAAVNRCDEQ